MAVAIGIFAAALALIASERIDRTRVAMLGALLMLLTQTLTQRQAIDAIDWGTLGLLAGMMVIVRLTERTGVYTYVAIRAGQLSRGRPLAVFAALAGTTGLLAAFLDNLTTILLMVPITFVLADALDVDPIPLIVVEIVASNIGGTATLIGDPPNILIAGHTGLSFGAFITNLAPIVIPTLVVVVGLLYLGYRRRLQVAPAARARVMKLDAGGAIVDPAELRRLLPVLALTMVAFFLHGLVHLEPATVALGGATIMLLLTRDTTEDALTRGIEWPTIFFFMGLFVMVGALEQTGVLREVANGIGSLTGGDRSAEILGITWASAIGSAFVDNIPFTAAMLPVVDQLQGPGGIDQAYWWALSLGACFGGNATIIAAAANVAGAGLAARAGRPITFVTFLKAGIPATLVSLTLATAYIALRYL
ncbi:MAG TPA: ArsB/NhaD family transporter [Conexibacter sp.]|jgi:Na+/H+ antiporter NhaD/arsenite permease-like protein|nr:ArsB/NhaD family transporter [Conexibacter sp.]